MNWKFVIRITGTMTAVLLLFASLLLFACSEFRFEQPLLINDMGQFGPVMAMQEEIHVEISGALSRQLKAVGAAYALVGTLFFAATLVFKNKSQSQKP